MVTKPRQPVAVALGFSRPDADEVDDLSIIYPSSDGEPMAESEQQYIPMTETVAEMRHWFRDRLDVYVIGDMLVYYRMNRTDIRVAPDIFVVFGVTSRHPRDSWLVWREGKAPDFVMEIASPGTWRRDVYDKRILYALLGVREYWRFDPTGLCFTPVLVGEALDPITGQYGPLPVIMDASGVLRGHSPLLGLEFRVEEGLRLRVYDPATGERLRTLTESEDLLQSETEARQAAETAVTEAEAIASEAETARQAAEAAATEAEAIASEAETARQAAEAAATEAEAARQAAEARAQALQEEIRRLREQQA